MSSDSTTSNMVKAVVSLVLVGTGIIIFKKANDMINSEDKAKKTFAKNVIVGGAITLGSFAMGCIVSPILIFDSRNSSNK